MCDQRYDQVNQLKRHYSDRHGPKLQCNVSNCQFNCPESRRYLLKNHMKEVHGKIITPPPNEMLDRLPLSPLRSPTPVQIWEPESFDFLCHEALSCVEPPRKVKVVERNLDINNNSNSVVDEMHDKYVMVPKSNDVTPSYFTYRRPEPSTSTITTYADIHVATTVPNTTVSSLTSSTTTDSPQPAETSNPQQPQPEPTISTIISMPDGTKYSCQCPLVVSPAPEPKSQTVETGVQCDIINFQDFEKFQKFSEFMRTFNV